MYFILFLTFQSSPPHPHPVTYVYIIDLCMPFLNRNLQIFILN